jgi:hypothetical protein
MVKSSKGVVVVENKYPRLMESSVTHCIVLMIEEKTGIVIYSKTTDDPFGDYSDDWDMDCFSDYIGSITLSH